MKNDKKDHFDEFDQTIMAWKRLKAYPISSFLFVLKPIVFLSGSW